MADGACELGRILHLGHFQFSLFLNDMFLKLVSVIFKQLLWNAMVQLAHVSAWTFLSVRFKQASQLFLQNSGRNSVGGKLAGALITGPRAAYGLL